MALLRTAIARRRAERREPLRLPEIARVQRAAVALPSHGGAVTRRQGRDYDAIARGLLARAQAQEGVSPRDVRDGAWCLWETNPALAGTPAFRRVLAGIEQSDRQSPARALASSFLVSFDPMRIGIEAVAEVLTRKAPTMGRPWADLHATFHLFDVRRGPARVAKAALGSHRSPTAVLSEHGLGALDSMSGYAKACAGALLAQLAAETQLDPVRRVKLVRAVALRDGRLVFEGHGPLVADALVRPFERATPDEASQRLILDLVIGLFGDPRLHPQRWSSMREAEAIVRRWLVRASLVQFLDVVGQVADRGMWVPRRAFWEAVYRKDLIRDAWVVFDSAGAQRAKRSFGDELRFATFDSSVLHGHAVLIMTVGTGLVVEWSFSGKCTIWEQADAPRAPRPYRSTYHPSDLRHRTATDDIDRPVFATAHMSSETYHWQRKVASKLYRMTGVRLTQADYAYRL